ncbi:Mannosyl-oligosaccharide glucosidase [Heracleum sosnowskyi]|uniref:Mannosyl-oligosaccharide glucosidase n=1 Tax=Heracleum sosnowskyi TaxID=360622 RepID=A0AAD8JEP3_9APIA|nr:Mannosyl-oligosaccharide glucosidase [Heracleum sosnowskyi]
MTSGTGRRTARSRVKSSLTDAEDHLNSGNSKSTPKFRKHKARNNTINNLNFNLKLLLGFGILTFSIALFFIYSLVNYTAEVDNKILRIVTPFPSPKLTDLPMFQGEHKESLYWGTYRPNVYVGIRARVQQSLIGGMMWIGVKDGRYLVRHVCQDSDELKKYGWTSHNGRDYGHQVIIDQEMTLETSFFKYRGKSSGYGGDWVVRSNVQAEILNDEKQKTGHLFFYLADEGNNALSLGRGVVDVHESSILASGSREDVGNWQLHLKSVNDLEVHYSGFKTPHIHNLSDLVLKTLGDQFRRSGLLQLPDTSDDSSNLLVFQISARIPFKFDIAFLSGTGFDSSNIEERVSSLTGTLLTNKISNKEKELDDKFRNCFDTSGKLDSNTVTVGKAAIGNLLGGIGYFYGESKIALPNNINAKLGNNFISYWPAELYTAVPSRPFFPRGFLWDEGFHQLLIWRWDIYICLDIVGHWLDLMNIDGWIPREQILGAEALSKVPAEFVLQHPTNGNPPTLFLVLRDLVCSMKKKNFSDLEQTKISSFLERAFVRLEAWFQWFNTTQSGKETNTYFWHGRDSAIIHELNPKTLSSGFDDYPRASHPSDEERHLDLRCWMFLAADCMHSISELFAKKTESGKKYGLTSKLLSDFELLNKMHFDNSHGTYFDFGNHSEKVRLVWQLVEDSNGFPSRKLVREVSKEPVLGLVPHIGYISLFPMIWRIIPPQSWVLGKQLDIISNKSILWTEFGLRSLGKTSSMYMKRNTEHDPPYWRGPIWMNMNYLILSSLHHYSKEDGPYRERAETIYNELRSNLIRTVVKNYQQTGYFWEQYDQKTGKGKGARVFTGWTSLVLLIMAEGYSEC